MLCAAIAHVGAAPAQQPDRAAAVVPPERVLIDRYCATCHSDRLRTGGLSLSAAEVDPLRVADDVETWEKVVRKLRARAMPPPGPGRLRPDEQSYLTLVSHLETALDRVAAERPDPGPAERFRRLNRAEYENAVRDLLDLEVDAASLLPADDSSHGFDNVNVSGVSPTLLDRYLAAAQKVSRLAVGRVGSPVAHTVVLPPDLTQDDRFDELPFGTRGGTTVRYTFPADGEYRFDIRLTRDRDERIEGRHFEQLDLMLDQRRVKSFTLSPRKEGSAQSLATFTNAAQETDVGLNVRVPVTAGPHEVAVTFVKTPTVLNEAERQPYRANYSYRERAAIFSVTVSGPFEAGGPGDTPSRRRIFSCRPPRPSDEGACARTILSALARRAYRRPVTTADVDPLLGFYEKARHEGEGFETGIEMALRALLASPGFLFRVETPPVGVAAGVIYEVGDIELASRLSFFLWSTIPDEELLDVAARGRLREAPELARQVRRMLADRRADALVANFAGQWLYLRNLESATRDIRLFPDFDHNLRQAFKRETELLFESILREDRSVLDLLHADYTFLNERLARHYGIPGVYGSHFRRVALDRDSVRRGLLGQASVLTVTSYANRTSPVQRGKWVLENILGMPPPPPPPDVPPLNEGTGGKVLSMRERMAVHRANPTCATCHNVMDPIGLAFENFDAVGGWRTRLSEAGEPAGEPIDSSGGLPDGSTFEGVPSMRAALQRHGDLFVATVTEKLMVYALGRGLEPPDAAAVRRIVRSTAAEPRFSEIVMGVVTSTPFRMRRSE
jgi:hypothetical protein